MADISKALPFILANEGGFVNHPSDPGGATNFGITLRTLSDWRKGKCTVEDVRELQMPEVEAIYKANYWDACNLDAILDQGVATAIFDISVLRGPGAALRLMYETCINLSKKSTNDCDPEKFISEFQRLVRRDFKDIVKRKPRLRVFFNGWMNRAKRLLNLIKGKK